MVRSGRQKTNMCAQAAQDVVVLKMSTSTCIKEMWRVVEDLEDRRTDLRHSSMHKFVGRSISPTGKGTRMYHHSLYSESKSKFYKKL